MEADADRPGAAAMRLAEILGATVLAGELSLLAAFTSGDLVANKPPRRQARFEVSIAANFVIWEREFPCVVTYLSRMGAAITVEENERFFISDEGILILPDYGSIASVIRHIEGENVGGEPDHAGSQHVER